jgi:hypothetical protein
MYRTGNITGKSKTIMFGTSILYGGALLVEKTKACKII